MANDPKIDYDAATVGVDAYADLFDSGGTLTFYTVGSGIPTNADDAITDQTSLCAITTPSPSFGAGANGVAAKSGTWSDTVGTGGEPAFFRLVVGSNCFQGTVGLDSGTFDLEFANVTWLAGGTVTVSTFTITVPRE
jgi:hypothetical protein